ncbi:hypothetical protein [Streptococcus dysgalactiae]
MPANGQSYDFTIKEVNDETSENFKKSTEALLEAAKEGKTDTIDLGK